MASPILDWLVNTGLVLGLLDVVTGRELAGLIITGWAILQYWIGTLILALYRVHWRSTGVLYTGTGRELPGLIITGWTILEYWIGTLILALYRVHWRSTGVLDTGT